MANAIRKRTYNTIDDGTASKTNCTRDNLFLSGITKMGPTKQHKQNNVISFIYLALISVYPNGRYVPPDLMT